MVHFIDQIVLIPGWGIKSPIHINALLRRSNGRNRSEYAEAEDSNEALSNVTPLGRKVS